MLVHDQLKRFKELEDRLDMLEQEVKWLRRELANKLDGTKFGGWPRPEKYTPGCQVCGLGWDGAMGYVEPIS